MASPYRADHVGSLLRPPELLEVKAQFAEGKVTEDQLRAAEDAAVLKALELQKNAGIDVVTDGEYRRVAWSAAALLVAATAVTFVLWGTNGPAYIVDLIAAYCL